MNQLPITNYQLPAAQLAQDLFDSQCVRFGEFKLKSGILSPIYLDLRRLITYPQILRRAAQSYAALLSGLQFDRIAGIPYAGLPIATAISLEGNWPMIYPRKEAKAYGTKAEIEGLYEAGETIVMIDDLITDGGAKIEAADKLKAAGLVVKDIVVLIDRGQGGKETLAAAGYTLRAVTTLKPLLDAWLTLNTISQTQFDDVQRFLAQ
jgi:uridine monophosphate synthetase